MSFKSSFKVYDNPSSEQQKRSNLKWSDEIMLEKQKEPRQNRMSPLAEWWINEQSEQSRKL